MKSLLAYARQFLERMKFDMNRIDGISPAIAIRQKNSIRNPRSTVGTTTEIHKLHRSVYTRVGRTFCRNCGRQIVRETAEVMTAGSRTSFGTRLLLGFNLPVVSVTANQRGRRPTSTSWESCRRRARSVAAATDPAYIANGGTRDGDTPGWSSGRAGGCGSSRSVRRRTRRDRCSNRDASAQRFRPPARRRPRGEFDDVDPRALASQSALQVVVNRVQLGSEDLRQRLTDSIETAYLEGGGAARAVEIDGAVHQFSELFECRECGIPSKTRSRVFFLQQSVWRLPDLHGFGNIIELNRYWWCPTKRSV